MVRKSFKTQPWRKVIKSPIYNFYNSYTEKKTKSNCLDENNENVEVVETDKKFKNYQKVKDTVVSPDNLEKVLVFAIVFA